jgi:hypothetical protein
MKSGSGKGPKRDASGSCSRSTIDETYLEGGGRVQQQHDCSAAAGQVCAQVGAFKQLPRVGERGAKTEAVHVVPDITHQHSGIQTGIDPNLTLRTMVLLLGL